MAPTPGARRRPRPNRCTGRWRCPSRAAAPRPAGQLEALPARDVDPRVDAHGEVAEGGTAGDPGQRLSRQAPLGEPLQQRPVTTRACGQLVGFLFRRDEARPGQAARQRGDDGGRVVSSVEHRPGDAGPGVVAAGRSPADRRRRPPSSACAGSGARRRGWAGTGSG